MKSVDIIAKELGLSGSQVLGLFNRTIRQISQELDKVFERSIEEELKFPSGNLPSSLHPLSSLHAELKYAARVRFAYFFFLFILVGTSVCSPGIFPGNFY